MTSCMWYRVRLRPDQIAAGHVEIIRRRFVRAIARAPDPAGACLFASSHETPSARTRDETVEQVLVEADVVFFSPASVSLIPHLIARYAAEPSAPPERARAALLVGDERAWELLPHGAH